MVILFFACQTKKQKLSKLWFFTHTTGLTTEIDTSLNPACFLNLDPSGKYTSYFTKFDDGEWSVQNNSILLTSNHHFTTTLPIQQFEDNNLVIKINDLKSNYNFEGYADYFKNEGENPFSLDNNRWRIKPTHAETDKQLTLRLKNHLTFWEKYFAWAISTSKKSIDVRSIPSAIKVYGNGVGLKHYENLPQAWRNCFYDSTDCRKALVMLQQFFSRTDIAWPRSENEFKIFLGGFQQMQQKFN